MTTNAEVDMFERIGKLVEQNEALMKAIGDYLSEYDNPAPDYAHRHHLRERMRTALNASVQP